MLYDPLTSNEDLIRSLLRDAKRKALQNERDHADPEFPFAALSDALRWFDRIVDAAPEIGEECALCGYPGAVHATGEHPHGGGREYLVCDGCYASSDVRNWINSQKAQRQNELF